MLHSDTKRGLAVWLVALVIFGLVSVVGRAKGNDVVMHVADRFHEVRSANYIAQKNYTRAIEEYKAWLWLDETHVSRTAKLVELHLQQNQVFEAYNRLSPLVESMEQDDYTVCRMMALVRTAQQEADAVAWAERAQSVASESQQAEAQELVKNTQ